MNSAFKDLNVIVPARLGSNRVMAKNLRLLDGIPLISHIIRTLKQTNFLCRNIEINSDSELFATIAKEENIGFYKRRPELATSDSLIDDYIYDYMKNNKSKYLAVVNPTSPFITSNDLDNAFKQFMDSGVDTLLSCEKIQTHCFYENEPINFNLTGQHPRSQDLSPVLALNFAITIWKTKTFMDTYEKNGYGVYSGKLSFFKTEGFADIDIDYPEDFELAQVVADFLKNRKSLDAAYPDFLLDFLKNNPDIKN